MASRGRQVEREREREEIETVCSFLNFASLFFTLGTRLRISKFCVDLCKKSDCTRCLAVSILDYNCINWNSKSAERAKAFWFSEGRTK